ncbi:MAG: site-specific integrase [Roseburia sp.]|nr:site-specific integrase [Eubacterium sp.]MCM1246749.1 site-specific integrase [Roseburia sp.]
MQIYEDGNVIYGAFGQNEKEKETEHEETEQKATLGELVEDWNTNVNYLRNTQTTWRFTSNIQKHVFSFFKKDFKLEDMTSKKIMEYMTFLKKEKRFSPNTINKHRSHLVTLFEYATVNEDVYHLLRNPVRKVKPLRFQPYTHHIYQQDEAREILKELKASENPSLEVAVSLALLCGLRREEVCGLRWNNVDLEQRIITVCEVRTTAGKEIVDMKHTKNNTVRQVGIPNALYDTLLRLKKAQKKDQKELGAKYENLGFVLSEKDGTPWHPNNITKRWARFIDVTGFRYIRYHDLRHTNLSLLMSKMSAIDVAKLGGHKKVSTTTNIYGHSFNNVVQQGIKTINDLLK